MAVYWELDSQVRHKEQEKMRKPAKEQQIDVTNANIGEMSWL